MADITLPQLGETVTEGTITRWFKKVGDTVAADEPLFEVSTDKVDTEVPSPVAGTLTEIRVNEGDTVPVGTVIAVVGAANAAAAPASRITGRSGWLVRIDEALHDTYLRRGARACAERMRDENGAQRVAERIIAVCAG